MFGLNPYVYLASGVAVLGIAGGFYALDHRMNHYKHLLEDCQKEEVRLHAKIDSMTTTQNTQTGETEKTVIKVVQGPERVKTIIQKIHDAPEPADCGTPVLPEGTQI